MSPPPEYPAAVRTEGKGIGFIKNKGGDEIFCILLGKIFQFHVTIDTTGVRGYLLPKIEMFQNLLNLVLPLLALQEQSLDILSSPDQSGVLCQEDSALFPGYVQQFIILDLAEEERIEPKDLEPFGQFPQHAVNDEFHVDPRGMFSSQSEELNTHARDKNHGSGDGVDISFQKAQLYETNTPGCGRDNNQHG